jgi:hypothetical protein
MEARDEVLDEGTAERMLQGRLPIDDAPPRYRGVAHAIALAGGEATDAELCGSTEAVSVIAASLRREADREALIPRRSSMSKRRLTQFAAAGMVGSMSLFGGLAAANALPGAAQSVASDVLSKVGVDVPSPNSHADGHPDARGQSGSNPSATSSSNGKGSTISDLARNTTETGVDKGAAISGAASDGKSQAGEHGGAAAASGGAPAATPPVETPNDGGTPTADTASGGESTQGTGTADTNSDGHSADGSVNATTGLTHKP